MQTSAEVSTWLHCTFVLQDHQCNYTSESLFCVAFAVDCHGGCICCSGHLCKECRAFGTTPLLRHHASLRTTPISCKIRTLTLSISDCELRMPIWILKICLSRISYLLHTPVLLWTEWPLLHHLTGRLRSRSSSSRRNVRASGGGYFPDLLEGQSSKLT